MNSVRILSVIACSIRGKLRAVLEQRYADDFDVGWQERSATRERIAAARRSGRRNNNQRHAAEQSHLLHPIYSDDHLLDDNRH